MRNLKSVKTTRAIYTPIIIYRRCEMKDRKPCIHGSLCREIYKLTGCIYSVRCPYGCKFYKPVKMTKVGEQK